MARTGCIFAVFLVAATRTSGAPTLSAEGLTQIIDSSTTLEEIIGWANAASSSVTVYINSTSVSETDNTLHVSSSLVIDNPVHLSIVGVPFMYVKNVSLVNVTTKESYYGNISIGAHPKIDFDDESATALFDVDSRSLTLQGLTLTATSTSCIHVSDGAAELTNCTFQANTGCLIDADHSQVTVTACVAVNNTNPSGATMEFHGNTSAHIDNTLFTFNSAATEGGAIAASGSKLDVTKCTIEVNRVVSSSGTGGAIAVNSSVLTIEDSFLNHNLAAYGGGICAKHGTTVTVERSSFEGNIASSSTTYDSATVRGGGAISLSNTSMQITETSFISNRGGPGSDGGAIHGEQSSIVMRRAAFGLNLAYHPGRGGAVYCHECDVTLEGQNEFGAKSYQDVPQIKRQLTAGESMEKGHIGTTTVTAAEYSYAVDYTKLTSKKEELWTKARPVKDGKPLHTPDKVPGMVPDPAAGMPDNYYSSKWEALNHTQRAPNLGQYLSEVTDDFRFVILNDVQHDTTEYYEVTGKKDYQPELPVGDGARMYLTNSTYTSPAASCTGCNFVQ